MKSDFAARPAPAAESAGLTPVPGGTGAEVILHAAREDGRWVTRAGSHHVVVHGRTLRALQASAEQALALRSGRSEAPPVRVVAVSPALDALSQARAAYESALRGAVQELRDAGANWSDVALVCQVRVPDAQAAARPEAGRQ